MQINMFEYKGKPFANGLAVYALRVNKRIDLESNFAVGFALRFLEKEIGSNSVATSFGDELFCVPFDAATVPKEIPVRTAANELVWTLDQTPVQLRTNNESEREIIRRLVAKAISIKQTAAGWFVEPCGFAYHWSYNLSKQLYTDLMDVYPGFVFRPYVYENGLCSVMVDPKFKFVAKRNLRDVIEGYSKIGYSEERLQSLLKGENIIDTCPIVECPKRKVPSSDCRLKGSGKRRRLIGLDFSKKPSQANFGDLIKYHAQSVCRQNGLIANKIKDSPPIALVESFGRKECLEYPVERLREELKLQKLEKSQILLVMRYIRPSMSARWELTDNFAAYANDIRIGRSCQLELTRQFAEAGSSGKPWQNHEFFEEVPLQFGYQSSSYDPLIGLERNGPFDIAGRDKRDFETLQIGLCNYSRNLSISRIKEVYENLVDGFTRGSRFVGLKSLFRIDIPPFSKDLVFSDLQAIEKLSGSERPKIILVFTSQVAGNKIGEYESFKHNLTHAGIPSQFLLDIRLNPSIAPERYASYLKNVALAIYYKVGGTPWVLSRALDRTSCYVGLSMINRGELAYMSTQIFDPVGKWLGGWTEAVDRKDYTKRFIDRITDAQEVFRKARGKIGRTILHKDGEFWYNLELQPIIAHFQTDVTCVCVKKTAWPRLYNQNTRTDYMVPRGSCVQIEDNSALLATSGPPHMIPGSQRPIVVEVKDSKSRDYVLMDACKDIFNLSLVFGGYSLAVVSKPVTTHFASKALSMVSKFGIEESPALWKKAWFV